MCGTGVVGCFGRAHAGLHNGAGKACHVVIVGIDAVCHIIGKELVHTRHVQINKRTESIAGTQIAQLFAGGSLCIDGTDGVVGGQHKLVIVVPEILGITIFLTLGLVASPLMPVAVAGGVLTQVGGHDVTDVHDAAVSKVAVAVIRPRIKERGEVEVGRHGHTQSLGGRG